MGKLSELLRWNTKLTLKGPDEKDLDTIYIRIIGDHDLQEAYKLARIASADKRAKLRDVDSNDFKDEVLDWKNASPEECKDLIRAARENHWISQALSTVVRPDEVKLAEVAVDADAPTLEEQEKLDIANKEIDTKYQKDIDEFVDQKRIELMAELDAMELPDLQLLAQAETVVLLPLTVYMNELLDQKVWRAVYTDPEFMERGFDSIEDYRQMKQELRDQITTAYVELEARVPDLKN